MAETIGRTTITIVCLILGILCSHLVTIVNSDWVTITIAIVMMSDKEIDKSFVRGLQRSCGTIASAIICTFVILFISSDILYREILLVLIAAICSVLAGIFIHYRYFFLTVIITSIIILLNSKTGAELIYARVIDIFIGVAIALLGLLCIKKLVLHD